LPHKTLGVDSGGRPGQARPIVAACAKDGKQDRRFTKLKYLKPLNANRDQATIRMVSPEIAHALSAMQPGTHGVLIYDSPENKRDVLFRHLSCGEHDSKLVYVCSEEKPEQIRDEMETFGIDVSGLGGKERLTVANYDEVYIGKDGRVDIPGIIDGFAKQAWGCQERGFRSFRASAEMSCFFRHGKVVELVEYEKALGKKFYFPGMGMCAYNVVEMQSAGCMDILMPLLRAHGLVILTGPKGDVILQSERIRPRQVEQAMQIRI